MKKILTVILILLSTIVVDAQPTKGSPFVVSYNVTWSNNGSTAAVTAAFNCQDGGIDKPYPKTAYLVQLFKCSVTSIDTTKTLVDIKTQFETLYGADNTIIFNNLTKDSLYNFFVGFSNDSGNTGVGLTLRSKGDPTGITDIDQKSISVFPNPFSNTLNITTQETQLGLRITDVTGREIVWSKLQDGSNSINTESFPSGIYFATLTDSKGLVKETRKIFKE